MNNPFVKVFGILFAVLATMAAFVFFVQKFAMVLASERAPKTIQTEGTVTLATGHTEPFFLTSFNSPAVVFSPPKGVQIEVENATGVTFKASPNGDIVVSLDSDTDAGQFVIRLIRTAHGAYEAEIPWRIKKP